MKYSLWHEEIKPFGVDKWYLLEEGVDFSYQRGEITMQDKVIGTRTMVYEAEDIPELLHLIQDTKDWRFYVVTDSISSKGRKSSEEYPHHRHICTLAGFIPEVCDIRQQPGKHYFGEKWVVEYCSELWVCHSGWGGEEMHKVFYFTEKIERVVREYLKENNLTLGMEEDKDE